MRKISTVSGIILIIGITALSVWVVFVRQEGVRDASLAVQPLERAREERGAVLSLVTDKKQYRVGEIIEGKVLIDTPLPVSGADVYILFDPAILEVATAPETENVYLKKGDAFATVFPSSNTDDEGVFSFSALSAPDITFTGRGQIATFYFKPLRVGETVLSFKFLKGSHHDTNVASNGRDVLKQTRGASLSITD